MLGQVPTPVRNPCRSFASSNRFHWFRCWANGARCAASNSLTISPTNTGADQPRVRARCCSRIFDGNTACGMFRYAAMRCTSRRIKSSFNRCGSPWSGYGFPTPEIVECHGHPHASWSCGRRCAVARSPRPENRHRQISLRASASPGAQAKLAAAGAASNIIVATV